MKKLLVMVGVLLLGVGAFYLFRGAPPYTNDPPLAGSIWVAFGDSLTSGVGSSPGNDYPSLLSQRLGIPILNLGSPGATTADAISRVEEIIRLKPSVVLLAFGGNDTLNRVPPAQTFQNLAAVIDQLHQAGVFVVLLGIRSANVFDQYDSQFKKLAKAKRVLFVPNILGGVLSNPGLMSDYVHPNDQGYAAIAARIEKSLSPLVTRLIPPRP